jgi:hypothetical protein
MQQHCLRSRTWIYIRTCKDGEGVPKNHEGMLAAYTKASRRLKQTLQFYLQSCGGQVWPRPEQLTQQTLIKSGGQSHTEHNLLIGANIGTTQPAR